MTELNLVFLAKRQLKFQRDSELIAVFSIVLMWGAQNDQLHKHFLMFFVIFDLGKTRRKKRNQQARTTTQITTFTEELL